MTYDRDPIMVIGPPGIVAHLSKEFIRQLAESGASEELLNLLQQDVVDGNMEGKPGRAPGPAC